MTMAEWKEKKEKEFKEKQHKPMQKISNNFIDNTINKNSINAIKTVFYLASILDDFDSNKRIDTIKINLKDMFKHTKMTSQEVRNNLKMMQETSITFINEKEDWEIHIVLIPRIEFHYGKNIVEIDLYSKIANLIVEVKNNYTYIDTKILMSLKSKHTIRILPLLEKIKGYDSHIGKRKKMSLEALNDFFGTKYKRIPDIERRILKPAQEELDNKPTLTFIYETHMECFGKGRPRATGVTIDLIIPPIYYLSNKKVFIEHMRNNFVNKNILDTIDKHTHQQITVSITTHGKLYDKKNDDHLFDAKRANELWSTIYEFAKKDNLEILKE